MSGYEYHPTNTNLWKTPLEEALEELFPLDYLDASGDSHSSPGDYTDGSSDGGDATWGSSTGWQANGSDEDGDGGSGGLRLFGETWVWPWSEDAAGFLETAKAYARAGARAATGAASGAATGAVSGAVTGAVTGAIVGSAAGGVGAIPGATIGASVGAKSGAISGAISGLISAATADDVKDAARDGAGSGAIGGALGGSLNALFRVSRWWNLGRGNDAAWRALSWKDKLYYEIGKKTAPDAVHSAYSHLTNAVDIGKKMVADQGWLRALVPYPRGLILGAGKTFKQGPTAADRYFIPPLATGGAGLSGSWFWDWLSGNDEKNDR